MRNVPIYEALHDIRELKRRIVDGKLFQGYSGVARMIGGTVAIVGMLIMFLPFYPKTPTSHIIGWGIICVLAGGINFLTLEFREEWAIGTLSMTAAALVITSPSCSELKMEVAN